MKKLIALVIVVGCLWGTGAEAAKNFQLRGTNEISGGIGFAAGLTDWAPGGFKWFNDYSHALGKLVWLNVQLNVSVGSQSGWGWCYDSHGRPYRCDNYYGGWHHFGGNALETAIGVKLKWRLRSVPVQFHVKIGGILSGLFLWNDVKGIALGPRGGFGFRYFFVPSFGLGAELLWTIGPAWLNNSVGWQLYSTLDFNIGVEYRW